jgi:hypothetical protein
MVALTMVLPIAWLLPHGELYEPILNSMFPRSTAFLLGIVISFIALGIFGIAYIFLVIKLENIKDPRGFFKVETLDVKGIWLCVRLGLALQVVNAAFLWRILLKPAVEFLSSIGLPGGPICLGTVGIVPALSNSGSLPHGLPTSLLVG